MQDKNFFLQFQNTKDFLCKMYLTLFFSGLSKKAPGTLGTLVALPFGWALAYFIALCSLFLLALLVSVIAIKIIDNYESQGLNHDRQEIVIDELAGVWISIAMIGHTYFALMLAFILFRIFDIWKPSIIGRIDKNTKGGLGVMGDDLLAGFFAGLLGLILIKLLSQFQTFENLLKLSF